MFGWYLRRMLFGYFPIFISINTIYGLEFVLFKADFGW